MTRDEIYDHLAQVYLGKRKRVDEKKRFQFNAWLVINILITAIIFSSAFYGLSAFLKHRSDYFESKIIYALHRDRIFLEYNFRNDLAPVKTFALNVPEIDVSQYGALQFSVRAREEGNPGIIKIEIRNEKNEVSAYYVQGISYNWEEITVPLDEFKHISDWSELKNISFILESWNVSKEKGVLLIDNVRFANTESS